MPCKWPGSIDGPVLGEAYVTCGLARNWVVLTPERILAMHGGLSCAVKCAADPHPGSYRWLRARYAAGKIPSGMSAHEAGEATRVSLRSRQPPTSLTPSPSLSPHEPRTTFARSLETGVLSLLLAALAADFILPMQSGLTLALLAAVSLLALPWARFTLRGGGQRVLGSRIEVLVFRLSVLALAVILLLAKWWLWFESGAERESYAGSSRSYGVALGVLFATGTLSHALGVARFVTLVSERPARLIMASFGALGVLGGLLLSLPMSMQRLHELSMLDNLFMAFSAVCVTGLSVHNLSTTYTVFGQVVICALVQVGGLGIMVLSAAVALLTGQRLRIKSHAMLAESVDAESIAQLRKVIAGIITSTFLIEAAAAAVLYAHFSSVPALPSNPGGPPAGTRVEAIWAAIFHAISAFCNAGISSFEHGLVPFVGDPVVMGTVSTLVVLGGIGFPVIQELAGRGLTWSLRRRRERMSLHARIALRATALLLGAMALAYLLLEWRGALEHLGWFERVMAAVFQSASARTAGFNVVDFALMQPATLMLTCVVMFVGGCPGSCAGGIKTTTVAVMFASLRSELHGRPPQLLDRVLPAPTARKAIGVAFMSATLLSVALFLLFLAEPHPPLDLTLEVFSAFTTTGLSTGVTPKLSATGKLLVLLTMYIGRIGPLTLALAISGRLDAPPVQLPSERVLIG